jgi:hypothetical protein
MKLVGGEDEVEIQSITETCYQGTNLVTIFKSNEFTIDKSIFFLLLVVSPVSHSKL